MSEFQGPTGQSRHEGGSGELEPTAPGAELARRFPDPGLPDHVYRRTDTDPRAAKRAERQVALMFTVSLLGSLMFAVAFYAFPLNGDLDNLRWSRLFTGLGLGIALFAIGTAAVHWAKKLMPDDEIVEERHPARSTDEERTEAAAILAEGGDGAGFPRRKLIWGSLTGAMLGLAIPAIIPLRDLGPLPGDALSITEWKKGTRLVTDPGGDPILAATIPVGAVVHVLPDGVEDLNERAKSAVLLMRLAPGDVQFRADREGWDYNGIFAYSKICTHVGCPVGLYERTTQHLLCPCHQSTFDVTKHCAVIFGPAARSLPQLAITVDADGYLIAQQGFTEPVGPSFWERG